MNYNSTKDGLVPLSTATPSTFIEHSKKDDRKKFLKNVEWKKRNLIKEARVSCQNKYSPQGFTSSIVMNQLPNVVGKLDDVIIEKLEGLVALYFALSECVSKTQFLAILTLYVKTHYDKSVMKHISEVAESLFDVQPQSSDEKPSWLSLIGKALTDWKLIVNNPGFAKVSKVLTMLVTLGVLKEARLDIGGLNVFSATVQKVQCNATDMVDAVLETIVFFAEGGYQCFLQGSLKPLLYSNAKVVDLESRYIEMLGLWEYARNGNLQKFVGIDDAEFDKKLKVLVDELETAFKGAPAGPEKKILSMRWKEMSLLLNDFESSRVRGGLRSAPFCFKVFGESAVGKSTFTDVVMSSLLKANGFSAGDDHVITLNPDDKHMSNMRTYVTGIKIDDYGNTKLDYVDLAPSDWLIQICNNIKRYAVMADLANKGKISIEPAIVSITTNVEDLLAHQTSNEPVSIGRRAHVHVDLKVKKEFLKKSDEGKLTHMLDPIKVFEKYGESTEIQDIWDITVRDLVIQGNDVGGNRVAPTFTFEDKKGLTKVDIFTFLGWVIDQSKQHFKVQRAVVSQQTNLAEKLPWCNICNLPSQVCTCCEEESVGEIEPQFGLRIADVVNKRVNKYTDSFHRINHTVQTRVEDYAVSALLQKLKWFENSPYAKWTNWLPDAYVNNKFIITMMLYCGTDIVKAEVKSMVIGWLFATCFISMFSHIIMDIHFVFPMIFGLFMLSWCYATLVEHAKSAYYARLKRERNMMPELFKSIRENHVKYACHAVAGFGLIWASVKIFKALRASIKFQGELNPRSVAEIKQRDAEINPWIQHEPMNPGVGKTVGHNNEMTNRVFKNQWTMSYEVEKGVKHCNALAIKTCYFIMPKHMLPSEPITIKLERAGFVLPTIVDPINAVTYGDLAMFYVPNSPPVKTLLGYFSTDYERRTVPATMVFTQRDCVQKLDRTLWTHTVGVYNGVEYFNGSYYRLSDDTFGGLCMATFFSESVHKHILGFHLGGINGTPEGCGMSVIRPELENMIHNLEETSKLHLKTPQASDMSSDHLGKRFALNGDLHFKSPINFIPEDATIECYGNVKGRSTYHSAVIPTPITDIVEEVTGIPNTWSGPKFQNPVVNAEGKVDNQEWKPWYESLQYSSKPSIGFPSSHVERACDDYLSGLEELFDANEKFWKEDIKPLSLVETVSGIDGKRFIDSMKTSTSIGYPIGGPKSPHLVFLDPEEYPDTTEPKIFVDNIMSAYEEAEEIWAKGELNNLIFGSALKDEPTPINKDKVRVFQAAPILLQMALRKYYLPIARFLSMNPLVAECAVGINSAGPEWEQLAEHMKKHGDERIIAGDYSKYDLRMPAQLTQAAFAVMLEVARWTGNYSERDLIIMQSLIYEVTCPLVAFNGDLMRFLGTNPSGQNMTVYVNSLANSILHRMGFYDAYPDEESFGPVGRKLIEILGRDLCFRDVVALATYGDDAKGSVMKGFDKFNHISFATYLAKNDMKFTMPDKESEPVAFMTDEQADFLKRKNRFDDDIGHIVGMLDEKSIFKSLHAILRSKAITPEEVAAQNIDGALREWFFHGRDVFNLRQEQMKEVAAKANLLCTTLDKDFDTRVAEWKHKYES